MQERKRGPSGAGCKNSSATVYLQQMLHGVWKEIFRSSISRLSLQLILGAACWKQPYGFCTERCINANMQVYLEVAYGQ